MSIEAIAAVDAAQARADAAALALANAMGHDRPPGDPARTGLVDGAIASARAELDAANAAVAAARGAQGVGLSTIA